MPSSAATRDYNDAEFVVEGGQVLSDDALEALARLLIDLVDKEPSDPQRLSEPKRTRRPQR